MWKSVGIHYTHSAFLHRKVSVTAPHHAKCERLVGKNPGDEKITQCATCRPFLRIVIDR